MPLLSPYSSPVSQSLIQHPHVFQTKLRLGFQSVPKEQAGNSQTERSQEHADASKHLFLTKIDAKAE